MSFRTHARSRLFVLSGVLLIPLSAGCPSEDPGSPAPVDCSQPPVAPPCEAPEFEVDPDVVYGKEGEWARVVLNEVMASNRTTIADGTGRWADWLEIANLTDEDVDLTGWSLSDDPENANKHELDPMEVEAGGHLLLWGDNDPALGPTHLNFGLTAAGDLIGLYAPDGTTMDLITYGPQASDVSLARTPDGTGPWELTAAPTPGDANGGVR